MQGLDSMGFEKATPIQEQSIPLIMEGRDVLACAQTGTGKTAAFLLPIINKLAKEEHKGIHTLVVGPTRELVIQVDQQLEAFSYFAPISSIPIYGGRDGQSMEQEKRALKQGADIIVATPGRLTAHLDMGYSDLSTVKCLILDEADRMLDMGFAPAIMNIVYKLPVDRQTLLFSATMPSEIRKFAKQIMRDPAEVNIAISKPAANIMQGAYEIHDKGKIQLTEYLLQGRKNLNRVIIFSNTKKNVKELSERLNQRGMTVGAIHSDLDQDERERRLLAFRSGQIPFMVTTDVLARGIDITGIDLVINFDVPSDPEDYVHRIGRTARAEASGIAITYVNRTDYHRFKRIEEVLETEIRRQPLPPDLEYAAYDPPKGRSGGHRKSGGGRQPRGKGRPRKKR